MNFRLAKKFEAETILALYKAVIGTPFCTWNDDYPGIFEINNDLDTGNLFVLEDDGKIIGAASIVPENELDNLDFWSAKEKAGEFARVVLHPNYRGKGLAKILVSNVLSEMKWRGLKNVHISVAKENIPAQKTYERLGFATVGENEMWGHDFYLCELNLKGSMWRLV